MLSPTALKRIEYPAKSSDLLISVKTSGEDPNLVRLNIPTSIPLEYFRIFCCYCVKCLPPAPVNEKLEADNAFTKGLIYRVTLIGP